MGNWMDLHMHSLFSGDGCYTPEELADLCAAAGVRVAALSDHNSVKGVTRMVKACRDRGIKAVPAVELDCLYRHYQLHILGYGIDPDLPQWAAVEQRVFDVESRLGEQHLRAFRDLGLFYDEASVRALAGRHPINAEMIAEVALLDGRNDGSCLLAPYRPGGARADNACLNFYWDFCAPGGPMFCRVQYPPLREVLSLIRRAGGIPVLAHPGQSVGRDEAAILEILRAGIAGLETHCSYHDEDDAAFFTDLAQRAGVLLTVGSDFHGRTKPMVRLAQPDCPDLDARWHALRAALASAASA